MLYLLIVHADQTHACRGRFTYSQLYKFIIIMVHVVEGQFVKGEGQLF